MKKWLSRLLCILLLLSLFLSAVPGASAYEQAPDLSGYIRNGQRRRFVEGMLGYYLQENGAVRSTLQNGKAAVFFFEGCSDNMDDPELSDLSYYRVSSVCVVLAAGEDGVPEVTYFNDACSTLPDRPLSYGAWSLEEVGEVGPATICDGTYELYSVYHGGSYEALHIRTSYENDTVAAVYMIPEGYECHPADEINIHTRTGNHIIQRGMWSAGCMLVGDGDFDVFTDLIDASYYSSYGEFCPDQRVGTVTINRQCLREEMYALYGNDHAVDTLLANSRCDHPSIYLKRCAQDQVFEEKKTMKALADTPLMSLPCSNGVDARSVEVMTLAEGGRVEVCGSLLNTEGELWYEVSLFNENCYIYAGSMEEVELTWYEELLDSLLGQPYETIGSEMKMLKISYASMMIGITCLWVLVRAICCIRRRRIDWRRELQLMLVYICIVVVARFTFFPFSKVDGKVQPLVFDAANTFPFRINLVPFVHLMDYPVFREAMLNLIGNTAMFIPLGVVWPAVYKKLDTHKKVIAAGIGFSLCIEILQLPFYDRVSDIDDLILNSLGFLVGYGLYLLVKKLKRRQPQNMKKTLYQKMEEENVMTTAISSAALDIIKRMQQNELTESVIYEKIAAFAKGEENKQTLLRLAREEKAHYQIWKKYTGLEMKPEKGKVLKYTLLARILGFTFAVKLMERGEGNAQLEYELLTKEVEESVEIRMQEEEHEQTLLAMLDEERLQYVGSMVLGLNDALVELTGSLAGFAFALQNTRLIALSGLIVGISATFSMASSEFLAARSEGRSDALKSCSYTGIAYLLTVIALIAPYLIFPVTQYIPALICMLAVVILIIAGFTYYTSVAQDQPFKSRFAEMALISIGVAVVSFVVGILAKKFLGVDL
ncbi:MAG: VanZ family protein [Oscillospiraceae bacterium]|nr:VanZ family protein [Oscillospiraceae bacterium]